VPIGYIDIRAFAHATEDLDKVLTAVHNVLPPENRDKVVFRKVNLTGHHGNPIILIEARIKEKEIVQAVFEKLSSNLTTLDKEQLNTEIVQHIEKGNLYIRIDKQSAYLNQTKLSTEDSIHFQIHFKKSAPEEVIEASRRFGLLP
jgi:hypothetical protein